jgi:transposase-like protein
VTNVRARIVLFCPRCKSIVWQRVELEGSAYYKPDRFARFVCPTCPTTMQALVPVVAPKGPNEVVAHPRRP